MGSTSKKEKLAKVLAAGIKQAIRESKVPAKQVTGYVKIVTDNVDVVEVMVDGVPPFTTTRTCINGVWTTYLGHPETGNAPRLDEGNEQDTP